MSLAAGVVMRFVRDAMVRDIIALAPDTAIDAISQLFSLNGISAAPVIDRTGQVLGVVSLSDLVDAERPRSDTLGQHFYYRVWRGEVRAVGIVCGEPPKQTGVAKDVMSAPILTISADATVEDASRRMLDDHVHRLFVLESGRVTGLTSALDCLRAFVEDAAPARSPREAP